MNLKSLFFSIFWLALGAAVVATALFLFVPKFQNLTELKRTRAENQRQNEQLSNEVTEYRLKQERFQTEDSFVERTAHESGRIKKNEKVFFFPDEN